MKKSLQLLAFICLFFTSCATQHVVLLKPQLPSQYLDSEGFTTKKTDSLAVTFGYLFNTKDYLVFEVEVLNNTSDALTIDPQALSYRAHGTVDTTLFSSPVKAHSFDRVLENFDNHARQARRTATIIWLVGVGALVAVDVASIKGQSRSNVRYDNYNYSYTARLGVDLTANYFDAMIFNSLSKKEARYRLERSFLAPKTLAKSGKHIGTVYFPRNDTASKLTFNFKVGEQDFETTFKQEVRMR